MGLWVQGAVLPRWRVRHDVQRPRHGRTLLRTCTLLPPFPVPFRSFLVHLGRCVMSRYPGRGHSFPLTAFVLPRTPPPFPSAARYCAMTTILLSSAPATRFIPPASALTRSAVRARVRRAGVVEGRLRTLREVQPRAPRGQVVPPDAHSAREQGLPPPGYGGHLGIPGVAAVSAIRRNLRAVGWLTRTDLCRRGIKSRLVVFPDENHWVLNHKNRCVRPTRQKYCEC